MQVQGQMDNQEFAWKVCASLKVPAACNQVKKVKNHCTPPPVHHSIGKHCFLLLRDAMFIYHDICLSQVQHTITYAMALQCWAEWVHPPVPNQPCHLAESLQELWQVMKPLVSFGEEEVFAIMVPSNWMEVIPPWSMETMLQSPQESQKCHTCSTRAHPRGSMTATWSEDRPAATATQATEATEALAIPPWESRPCHPLSDSQPLCSPPGFLGIAQTLGTEEPMESSPPPVITSILTQETIDPYEVMGMVVMAARLLRNQATGEMLVDVQVCFEGIVGLRLDPKENKMTEGYPSLTILELPESDRWTCHSITWHSSDSCCYCAVFSSGRYANITFCMIVILESFCFAVIRPSIISESFM